MLGMLVLDREILLDTCHALDGHVLSNLHGIGAPGCHHLTTWAYIVPRQTFLCDHLCSAIEPT